MVVLRWNVVEDMTLNCRVSVGWSKYQSVLCSCFEGYHPVWLSWSMCVDHVSRAVNEKIGDKRKEEKKDI